MRRDRDRQLEQHEDTEFADECEAFLAGRWAEVREDTSRPLPMWAWLNPIAHGNLEQLQRLASMADAPSGPERLQVAVAHAVLSAIPPGRSCSAELSRVQYEVLVPLELRLMSTPVSPRQVLELVTDALY